MTYRRFLALLAGLSAQSVYLLVSTRKQRVVKDWRQAKMILKQRLG